MKKGRIALFNIVATDFAKQSLFTESLIKIHKDEFDQFCIFLDKKPQGKLPYKSISIDEISIPDIEYLKFKYDILELSTAVKPFVFAWLFQKYGYEKVMYFDSDMIIYKKLDLITQKLNTHEAVLTPHIRKQINDDFAPKEIDFAKSGYFNLGFIAFKKSPASLDFIQWWAAHTHEHGYVDFKKFYFVDQRWIDFVPIFLKTYIIKEPGYNVAYFNLKEYVDKVNPSKIHFFHFTGFNKEKISVYQNRFNMNNVGDYRELFLEYDHDLRKKTAQYKPVKYKHYYFDNGVEIGKTIKDIFKSDQLIKDYKIDKKRSFKSKGRDTIYNYIFRFNARTGVLNLFELIHLNSQVLKTKFPGINFMEMDKRLLQFTKWIIKNGEGELFLDKKIIDWQVEKFQKMRFILNPILLRFKLISLVHFIKILREKDATEFLDSIYHYLIHRPIDPKSYADGMERRKRKDFKRIVVYNLLNSEEFGEITKENKSKMFKYLILTKIFTKK